MNDSKAANKLTRVLFVIYSIALCWILLFKLGVRFSYMENRQVNLIPFSEALFLNGKMDLREMIMNVVIFIPLGIYAGVLFERWTLGKKLLLFFFMSLMFEALQFIFRIGAFDMTDIVTNTLGGIIGLMLFKVLEKAFKSLVRAQKFINVLASMGTVILIVLLFLLKMNMLPVRYQ